MKGVAARERRTFLTGALPARGQRFVADRCRDANARLLGKARSKSRTPTPPSLTSGPAPAAPLASLIPLLPNLSPLTPNPSALGPKLAEDLSDMSTGIWSAASGAVGKTTALEVAADNVA